MATDQQNEAAPKGGLLLLLDTIEGALAATEKRIAAVSVVVILLAIMVTIIARAANLPLPSAGELAIVAMAPLAFVGGAFCSYMHKHITIDAVDAFLPGALQRVVRVLASAAMAVFSGAYFWLSYSFFQYLWTSGERLIDLGTPVWVPVGFIVMGAFMMMLHAVLDIVRLTFGLPRTGAPA